MKISVLAVLAMLAFSGCMNDSDGDPAATNDGTVDGMPRLYSELDSIVFNQLDFLYFIRKNMEPEYIFSAAARDMLTDDTLLFQHDSIYSPYDTMSYQETFLQTKFNPKGWIAFLDDWNGLTCGRSEADPTGEWFIKFEVDTDNHRACYRTPRASPSSVQLWTTHYQDKGFLFHLSSTVAEVDLGRARVYYWR